MGVKVITGFTGSPIWRYLYSFPQTPEAMVEAGFDEVVALWTPILDEFDKYGVKFALEVHPGEIAFDYYSTLKLLEKFNWRETFGLNFDPSHLLWQGVKEAVDKNGFLGVFLGGFKASAAGISAALIFGYIASFIFDPKMKK